MRRQDHVLFQKLQDGRLYVKILIYLALGRLEKQDLVLYYAFSGQGMQINLCRIYQIKYLQNGDQIA